MQNNKRENAKHHPHVYSVDDSVMILHNPNWKHGDNTYKGPFIITKFNDNGTLQLHINTPHGGVKLKNWNIWNVRFF